MRPNRGISGLVLLVLLVPPTGCMSYLPLETPLPPEPSPETGWIDVKVVLKGGQELDLTSAWMDSVAIGGVATSRTLGPEAQEVRIPLSQVSRIEEYRFDRRETLINGVSVGLLGVGVYVLAAFIYVNSAWGMAR